MVSICMATYNGEKFIKEQIDSILYQIQSGDELIISDDSSTDRTIEIVKNYKDPRIKLLPGNRFRNPIKNFQCCLQHAQGEIVFLADQDDVWLADKYRKMLELLNQYDLVISNSMIVNEELEVLHPSFFEYFHSGPGILKNMIRSSYYGSCMAFSKRILKAALPFPDTREIGHDLWIGLVAEMVGRVYFYNEPLLLYRRHANAFTPVNVGRSKRTKYQMLIGRIIMLREVFKFLVKNK
jgi:glycosyltransferase involved in cell wall biosynthesis